MFTGGAKVTAGADPCSGSVPVGALHGGNLGPYSSQSYARGTGRTRSETDDDIFLEGVGIYCKLDTNLI